MIHFGSKSKPSSQGTEALDKKIKVISVVLVILILILAAGILYIVLSNSKESGACTVYSAESDNVLRFSDTVSFSDPEPIRKNLSGFREENNVYYLEYKNSAPEFFRSLAENALFYISPSEKKKNDFFKTGFGGKLLSVTTEDGVETVSFTVPLITELFSEIHIDSQKIRITDDAFFTPSSHKMNGEPFSKEQNKPLFTYSSPSLSEAADGYTPLADRLNLDFSYSGNKKDDVSEELNGSLSLKNLKYRFRFDHTEDGKADSPKDYDLGIAFDSETDIHSKAAGSLSFEKPLFNNTSNIIGFADEKDDGREDTVLGTYVIGFIVPASAADENSYNITLGLAIRFSISANGKTSAKLDIGESCSVNAEYSDGAEPAVGFTAIRASESDQPQTDSPDISVKTDGKNDLFGAVKIHTGIFAAGCVPESFGFNILDGEIKTAESGRAKEITASDDIHDETLKYKIGAKTVFILNTGAVSDPLGFLSLEPVSKDFEKTVFEKAFRRYPALPDFDKSQCGFSGIMLGEVRSDSELKNVFDSAGTSGLLGNLANNILGNAASSILGSLKIGGTGIFDHLHLQTRDCKINFFNSGAVIIRDKNDTVIGEIIMSDKIENAAGLHTGIAAKELEDMYSAPNDTRSVSFDVPDLVRQLLPGITASKSYECRKYETAEKDAFLEVFSLDDTVKLIILSKAAEK